MTRIRTTAGSGALSTADHDAIPNDDWYLYSGGQPNQGSRRF